MKTRMLIFAGTLIACLAGCTASSTAAPDVTDSIRASLSQAGLKSVSVSQDREKGVVTLNGNVPAEADKTQAAAIAKSLAGSQVVANQIGVVPIGAESDAKKINSELDDGMASNLKAALIAAKLDGIVKYSVKNFVVTLTGSVNSAEKREQAAAIAATVPYVRQVVNELQVKGQKATSSELRP